MKQLRSIFLVAVVFCVTMMNAGVLHAIHLHQCCDKCDTLNHAADGKHHSGSSHNPDKCPLCIQFAFAKTISFEFTEHINFTTTVAEEPFIFKNVFVPAVSLSSESPRAPPFVC